jgi:hypothetical protein
MPSVKVNLSHQQVRPVKARFLDHVSLWIDDLRTPETRKLPVPADDVGTDNPNPMLGRQCDVRTSRRGIQFERSTPVRKAVIGWNEEDACAAPSCLTSPAADPASPFASLSSQPN